MTRQPDDRAVPERPLHTEPWQDAYGRAKDLGEVWSLEKDGRRARCVLQGHPIGIEARVLVDDDLRRTVAFKDTKAMIDATTDWREAFEFHGWRAAK